MLPSKIGTQVGELALHAPASRQTGRAAPLRFTSVGGWDHAPISRIVRERSQRAQDRAAARAATAAGTSRTRVLVSHEAPLHDAYPPAREVTLSLPAKRESEH